MGVWSAAGQVSMRIHEWWLPETPTKMEKHPSVFKSLDKSPQFKKVHANSKKTHKFVKFSTRSWVFFFTHFYRFVLTSLSEPKHCFQTPKKTLTRKMFFGLEIETSPTKPKPTKNKQITRQTTKNTTNLPTNIFIFRPFMVFCWGPTEQNPMGLDATVQGNHRRLQTISVHFLEWRIGDALPVGWLRTGLPYDLETVPVLIGGYYNHPIFIQPSHCHC